VEVHEAGVSDPPLGFQGDIAGVTEDDDAPKPMASARVAPFATVPADAVNYDEVATIDVNPDAVPIDDANGSGGRVATKGSSYGGY
jgi:hypothetical protein